MTIRVHLMAGEGRSATIDLSWEGEVELELSVGPVIRGRFLNMPTIVLNEIANRTDVTLHVEGCRYEVTSVERNGTFEAVKNWT